MSWTSKQSVSLAGAILIHATGILLFSDQSWHSPGIHDGSAAGKRVQVSLAARRDAALMQSAMHPSMSGHQDGHASSTVTPAATEADVAILSVGSHYQSSRESGDYLPASQLTEKPLVLNDIDPELSGRFAFIHPQSLMLTLLINEYGDVDRVLVSEQKAAVEGMEETTLPAILLDELIQRFLETRFLPGRLHGQAVPSALTIRVSLAP